MSEYFLLGGVNFLLAVFDIFLFSLCVSLGIFSCFPFFFSLWYSAVSFTTFEHFRILMYSFSENMEYNNPWLGWLGYFQCIG